MIYFAYGSNINLLQLATLLAEHGVGVDDLKNPRHAVLRGYRLRTNYYSGAHRAGAANIELAEDQNVEEVVMGISEGVCDILRAKEGFPACYEETEINVQTSTGCISAFTYAVSPARRLAIDLPVTPEYRQLILDGARMFQFCQSHQRHLQRALKPIRSMLPVEG